MDKISVCMASYNGAPFIEKQLSTILEQIKEDDEIIISDDGSTGNTVDLIKGFKDPRIKLFHHTRGKSPMHNFENALQKASGQYIFLSDQDDIWEKNKVSLLLEYLQSYDLVISDCSIIDGDEKVLFNSFFKQNNSRKGFVRNLYKNSYVGCCMAFNRFILEKSLPLPGKIPMHDWWIGLTAEMFGSSFFCMEKLVQYRRHENNVSFFVGHSRLGLKERLKLRKNMIFPLFKAWRNRYKMMPEYKREY